MDYYSLLNLPRNCTLTDLKAAYRTLSFKHHPDLGGDQEMMKKVNLAYEQIKWELERNYSRQSPPRAEQYSRGNHYHARPEQPPKPEPKPAEPTYPDSKKPIKEWVEIIESLFADQVRAGRKPASVAFELMDNWEKPPLVIWKYLAKRLGYQKSWTYHQHRKWKPSVWADQD